MTRSSTVDILLDRCSDLQAQRDRAIVQRARYEADIWHVEILMKQVGQILSRLIATTPADAAAVDSLREEINSFCSEPRHHPGTSSEVRGDGEAPLTTSLDPEGAA